MKVCIISHFPPIEGGISTYSKRTVDLLRNEKVQVTVIPVATLIDSLKIYSSVKKNEPEIIRLEFAISMYYLSSFSIFLQLFLIRLIKKVKLTVNYHEVTRDIQMLGFVGIIFYKVIGHLFDLVTVHTHHAKNTLINKCCYPIEKLQVISHGLYLPKRKVNQDKLNTTNKFIILFFGYIHVHKGIEHLINAYKTLLKENPQYITNTELIIAGTVRKRNNFFKAFEIFDQRYYKSLKKKVINLNLESNITFLGYVDSADVNALMVKSHIFVLPYTSTEQSGVLNLVLPYEKPIIASNIGGLAETLSSTGILVKSGNEYELKNEMLKLLSDQDYYLKVKNRYKLLIKELNPNLLIKNYLSFYKYE